MDPLTITAIVTALSSGAAVTLGGALGEAGKDAYKALKSGVQKFVAPADLTQLEKSPDSEAHKAIVREELARAGPSDLAELGRLAHTVLGGIKAVQQTGHINFNEVEKAHLHLGNIYHIHQQPVDVPELVRALGEINLKAFQAGQGNPSVHRQVADLAGQLKLTETAVANMLRILGEQEVPLEHLDAKLREIAERHKDLSERLRTLSNDEPQVVALRKKAADVLESGDYDQADQFLSEAEALDERAIDEQQDAVDRRKLSAAQTLAERGNLERARLNYLKAAKHFEAAAARVPDAEEEARWRYLTFEASVLVDQGVEFGDNAALHQAIAVCQAALSLRPRARAPLDWATTQNNLGATLGILGERESGTAYSMRAVVAFRAALEERSRHHVPLDWAATQHNLGNVLLHLGERESGTTHLKESVAACLAALEERTRERVPLEWAKTQNNLGIALKILGERESGTRLLEESVTAFCAALEEHTRERAPLDWAMAQSNLANALSVLGERESSATRLEESVAAYRAALREFTRERFPVHWAGVQNNLANVLRILGERESGTTHLKESVAACLAALEERTRECVPLEWAKTQNNLGTALNILGQRERGTARLKDAVAAYHAALKELKRERVPLDWAMTQNNLGTALKALGERESSSARLEHAVAAYLAALEEHTRERVPLKWAMTQNNLGGALATLGNLERSLVRLEEAATAFRAALEEYEAAGTEYYVRVAKENLERVEALLRALNGK